MLIQSAAELETWIADNFGMHDAHVVFLDPLPENGGSETVFLAMRFQVAGGYAAGEMRTTRTIELVAHGVTSYTLNGIYNPRHPAECASHFEPSSGIGFEIDVPGMLQVAADRFEVRSSNDVEEPVPSWYDHNTFTAIFSGGVPPTPRQWIREFRRLGYDVAWRYYSGTARKPEEVPPIEYAGWFLQQRYRIPLDPGGLLVDNSLSHKDEHWLTLKKYDPDCLVLWRVASQFLLTFGDVRFLCGNVRLSADSFREYLESTCM